MDQLIEWNRFHIEALRFLFFKCYISNCTIEIETMLRSCYRTSEIGDGRHAVDELIRKQYIRLDDKSGKKVIALNKFFLPNTKKIIENRVTNHAETQPLENKIPDTYNQTPLFITEGDRSSKGVTGRYYYYQSKTDPYDIMYIIVSGDKQVRKFLGSLKHDPLSPISQVYKVAKQKRKFIKADFNTAGLPHTIVENRQPIKAAIDVLEYLNLVRKTGGRRNKSDEYEVTDNAAPPSSTLDDFRK